MAILVTNNNADAKVMKQNAHITIDLRLLRKSITETV